MVQAWITENKGNVHAVAPTKRGQPLPADLAIMVPRPEDSPISLAYYLGSAIPFAVLVPNDLLSMTFAAQIYPGADIVRLKAQFQTAGKIQILVTQMTWVIGNVPQYRVVEMFSQSLLTAAPITGSLSTTHFRPTQNPRAVDPLHARTNVSLGPGKGHGKIVEKLLLAISAH
jgi:hypothetical protein